MSEREVSYKLKIESDSRNGAAIDDVGKRAKQATADLDRMGKANAAAARGGGAFGDVGSGGAGGASGSPGGKGGLGFESLAKSAFIAVAAIKALEGGLNLLTKGINDFGNGAATAHQKTQSIGRAIPLIGGLGGAIQDFMEAIAGLPEAIRLAQVGAMRAEVEGRVEAMKKIKKAELDLEMEAAKARAQVTGDIAKKVQGSAALQEILAGEHGNNLGAQRQAVKAAAVLENERDTAIAQQNVDATKKEMNEAWKDLNKATATKAAAIAAIPRNEDSKGAADDFQILKKSLEAQTAIADQARAIERATVAEGRAKQAVIEAHQKTVELSKIEMEFKRQSLKALHQELSEAEAAAAAFGKLNPAQRATAVDAMKRLQQFGPDRIGDFEKDLIGKAGFGKQLDAATQKTGLADPAFREMMAAAGMKTVDAIKKEIVELKPQVTVDLRIDEKRLADALVKAMEGFIREAKVNVDLAGNNAKQQLEIQQRIANVQKK